jgi:D-alanyl-D-alanine carboxypeptidase (penicillin-binding protein 5/6)
MKPLITHKRSSIFALSILSLFLLLYPGQNKIQQISINPTHQKVMGVSSNDFPKADLPQPIENMVPLEITAKSAIVVDVDSAVIMYQKDPDIKLHPASTTKIMTAMIALDEYSLDEVVTIDNENFSIGNKSHIMSGEKLSVESLLYALLVSSGNDAALALAQHHPKGYVEFINLMNQKAKDLHLVNSNFSNVSGVEQPTHYTTARDLSLLTKEAIKNPIFSNMVSQKEIVITSIDGNISHSLTNTNQLLDQVEGVMGVKTGWTYLAGECLVTFVSREGREIITVVLASDDRFQESEKLINWSYNNYTWIPFPQID